MATIDDALPSTILNLTEMRVELAVAVSQADSVLTEITDGEGRYDVLPGMTDTQVRATLLRARNALADVQFAMENATSAWLEQVP